MRIKMLFAGPTATRFLIGLLLTVCINLPAAEPDPSAATTNAAAGSIENSVVKVFATMRYPDPFRPWNKEPRPRSRAAAW